MSICRFCEKEIDPAFPAMQLAGYHSDLALCAEAMTESPMELLLLRALFEEFSSVGAIWSSKDWPDQNGTCIDLYNSSEGVYLFPQFNLPHLGYRLDFAILDDAAWVGLAIEVDGHAYHKSKEQRTRDARRDRVLMRAGWRVIRFTGSEIRANPAACAEETRRILHRERD